MSEEIQRQDISDQSLIKEYELCQKSAHDLDVTIWQTSTAFGLGIIGTFILVANHPANQQPPFMIAMLIFIFSFFLSLVWLAMARRWWSIQHSIFIRMRHIEEDLGLYKVRYLAYLDDPAPLPINGLSQTRLTELNDRRTRNRFGIPVHQRWGVQDSTMLIPFLVILCWAIYLIWLSLN